MRTIKCDICGKFIPYQDLESGKAIHIMLAPDSDVSSETWDSRCKDCYDPYQAYNEGRKAGAGLGLRTDNPYPLEDDIEKHLDWDNGYTHGLVSHKSEL